MHVEDCVIIGGGIAGLSAANQLADAGLNPLLIEAHDYPAHRICGEFLSPECLPALSRWGIPVSASIQHCRIFQGDSTLSFQLPTSAASCSRYTFDALLMDRARNKGATILTKTTVSSLDLSKNCHPHLLTLSNGQVIKTRHLMIGTGRIPQMNQANDLFKPKYFGLKAHFEGVSNNYSVDMHCFDGGYLGVSPVDKNTTNVACLVKIEKIPDSRLSNSLMANLLEEKGPLFERLSGAKMLFSDWMTGQIPEFGMRNHPFHDNVFWIGDAAGSIPPISGDGLAMGITSGCMAADYLLRSNAQEFKKAWLKRYRSRFFWAIRLHKMMLFPMMSHAAIKTCQAFPSLALTLWKLTRE